jgi:hypothetical protein
MNKEAVLVDSKKVGVEVNSETTKFMFMYRQ